MKNLLTSLLVWAFLTGISAANDVAPIGSVAAPDVYKVIAENDQFRVLRATWQPGQEDSMHSHPGDRVSLFHNDCELHFTNADGSTRVGKPRAGKARVRTSEAQHGHVAKNIGDSVCVITIVELK